MTPATVVWICNIWNTYINSEHTRSQKVLSLVILKESIFFCDIMQTITNIPIKVIKIIFPKSQDSKDVAKKPMPIMSSAIAIASRILFSLSLILVPFIANTTNAISVAIGINIPPSGVNPSGNIYANMPIGTATPPIAIRSGCIAFFPLRCPVSEMICLRSSNET